MYRHFFKRLIDFNLATIALLHLSPVLIVVTDWPLFINKGDVARRYELGNLTTQLGITNRVDFSGVRNDILQVLTEALPRSCRMLTITRRRVRHQPNGGRV